MSKSTYENGRFSPATARIVPFAIFIGFIVLQSIGTDRLEAMGINPHWLYPARTVVVALALLWLWRYYTDLHDFSGLNYRWLAGAVGAGLVVFLLWINLDFGWATIGKPNAFDPTLPNGTGLDWVLVGFRVVGLAIVVPVMEELFWRSFLLRWIDQQDFLNLEPCKATLRAILISSLLFASEHSLWFAGLLAGLVYGVVYVRSGNLWVPVICHATTNGALAWWILATGQWQFW